MAFAKPTRVKIGPDVWKIYYELSDWVEHADGIKEDKDVTDLGQTKGINQIILIKGWDVPLTIQKETLQHEIFHACFGFYGFADMPIETDTNADTEEVLIRLLSPMYFMVLKENKDVRDWLYSK